MGNLSHKLIDLGFFSALGTSEYFDGKKSKFHVTRGTPNTYGYNNGVCAIYDEEGRPWILQGSRITDDMSRELCLYSLKRGAYVPHSNDGGYFVHEVMTRL